MKRYLLIAMTAVAAVMTGCFNNPEIETPRPDGQATMALEFELPQIPEIEVATRSAADDAARENHIARLDIFVFDENGDIVAGDEGHKKMIGGVTTVNGRGRAQINVTIPPVPGHVFRQFFMVANGNDALFAGIATVAGLNAIVVSGVNTMPREEFLMSGSSPLNKIDTPNPTVNMSLRRVVSRVDVLLADGVTNFEITQARLINARNGVYVYEHLNAESNVTMPAGSTLTNYVSVPVSEESHKRKFTSLLYCNENYDSTKDDATTTAVIIGGVYKGQEVFYRVNLHDNASQAQVRRNYAYNVRILAVNGPGNTSADGAILDAPQNIDYEIVDWDYSLHCDVVYDGKHYLGLSRSDFTFGKVASTGIANIVTNLDAGDVTVVECDQNGVPSAWTWLDGAISGSKVNVSVTQNNDNAPRVGYLLVKSSTKSRLKLIIKVQQYHSDDMLMTFSPSVIMAPTAASNDKTSTGTFTFPNGTQWMIESVNMLEDASRNWFRVKAPYNGTGVWMDSAGAASVTLGFDVDVMNPQFVVRTAVVTIKVKYGAMEEKKTITVSQSNATEDLTLSRYYIGKTSPPAVEKVDIMSYGVWNAYFVTNTYLYSASVPTKGAVSWAYFADKDYNKLPGTESYSVSGAGSGSIYIVFDAVTVDQNCYIAVESGGKIELIRLKRFTGKVDKINGSETMMISGHYQWGRTPDGYEGRLEYNNNFGVGILNSDNTFNSTAVTNKVNRQPRFGDASYGKTIYPGAASISTPAKTMEWLTIDNSITPPSQRNKNVFWDAKSVAADVIGQTNLTGVKTEFDPCPDGWRVPTAREMENIFAYGPNRVDPSSVFGNSYRYVQTDDGKRLKLPLCSQEHPMGWEESRIHPLSGGFYGYQQGTKTVDTFTYWWTSSMSASGGPYMVRFWNNDHPEVMWTSVRSEQYVTFRWPAGELEPMVSMLARVRCVRDNQIEEELIVSRRRLTVDFEAQSVNVDLDANNIIGNWSAVSSDPSWLIIDGQSSGSDDATLTLRVTQNNQSNRDGYIRITTPSGSVANIVVRQTDHTGVKIAGTWWQDRNVGATRGDHNKPPYVDNLTTHGYYYLYGTTNAYSYETGGAGAHNANRTQWNLNSRAMIMYTSVNTWLFSYPHAVKNVINDPCPDGWRVPTTFEMYILQDAFYTAIRYSTAVTVNNLLMIADNGREVCFPAADYYRFPGVRNATFLQTADILNQGHHSAVLFLGAVVKLLVRPEEASTYPMINIGAARSVRCIQDIPDDWTEYIELVRYP